MIGAGGGGGRRNGPQSELSVVRVREQTDWMSRPPEVSGGGEMPKPTGRYALWASGTEERQWTA